MPRFASGDKGRSQLRLDYSAENQSRCPGFYRVIVKKHGGPYEQLARCVKPHPHQVALSVDEDGNQREVPIYPFIADLLTEEELLQSQQGECERIERSDAARKQSGTFKLVARDYDFVPGVPFSADEDSAEQEKRRAARHEPLCPDCSKVSARCVCDIPF